MNMDTSMDLDLGQPRRHRASSGLPSPQEAGAAAPACHQHPRIRVRWVGLDLVVGPDPRAGEWFWCSQGWQVARPRPEALNNPFPRVFPQLISCDHVNVDMARRGPLTDGLEVINRYLANESVIPFAPPLPSHPTTCLVRYLGT